MTNPTYFTVVADFKSVVVDLASDVDPDPQLGPITAKVTFTPVLGNGDVILATNASPRPTVFVPAPIVARIDTDGRLKLRVEPDGDRDDFANLAAFPVTGNVAKVYFAIDTQTFYRWDAGSSQYIEDYPYAQVRLLADTNLLELNSPLYYRVTFSEVVFNGGPGYINSFTFQAPTSDTELNLVDVARVPGQPASGITKIAPGAVRAEDGNLIFSFGGVDLDEPIPYTDVDVTLDAADISDGTPTGRALITAASAAAARKTLNLGMFDARDYGVIADGAEHNNVANLLDCVAACAAAGGGTVLLPAGTIVTSEADLGTVTADSGNTYTNRGGIPLPEDTPITIQGHGVGVTVIKLSPGFTRGFDFRYAAEGESYHDIVIKGITFDRDDLRASDIAPLTQITGSVTLTSGVYTTLPGLSPAVFKNADFIYFPPSNSGTSKNSIARVQISGGQVKVRGESGTSLTVASGDYAQAAIWGHVIAGTHTLGYYNPGTGMTIDNVLIEDCEAVNVYTDPPANGVNSPDLATGSAIGFRMVNGSSPASLTNLTCRRVKAYGGLYGFEVKGTNGPWLDNVWFEDCFHDTMVDPPNYFSPAINFMVGQGAYVGRVGLLRCIGRRSWDVGVEIDQPWEAYEIDCRWEDCSNAVYRTSFNPPARSADGPPTTTLNNGGTLSSGATTCTVTALPAEADREGLARLSWDPSGTFLGATELVWYQATNDAGTQWTIWRGINGTTATTHANGARVTFVQTDKTRFYSIRSSVVNEAALTADYGLSWSSYSNYGLPLPPLTIRDANVNLVGGDLFPGQVIKQHGWCPDVDIEGLRVHHTGLANTASDTYGYGAMYFYSASTADMQTQGVPCPPPRVVGRNNRIAVTGRTTTSETYNAVAQTGGWFAYDLDIELDASIRGAASKVGFNALQGYIQGGSRLGITVSNPTTEVSQTSAFSAGGSVTIGSTLAVDVDASGVRFTANSTDSNYIPFSFDPKHINNLAFKNVKHSTVAVGRYPQAKQPATLVSAAMSPYSVTSRDETLLVDTSAGAVTINLPPSTGGGTTVEPLTRGRVLTIVDAKATAATNAITVTPVAADKINAGTAGASQVLSRAADSLTLTASSTLPGWVGVTNTVTNLPASATPLASRLVCTTAAGGSATEDGANTWAKIATVTLSASRDFCVMLQCIGGYVASESANVVVAVRSSTAGNAPTVTVDLTSKAGSTGRIGSGSFKAISGVANGSGVTEVELWMLKTGTFSRFAFYEIAKHTYDLAVNPIVYNDGAAWQSATPTGASVNVSSAGVTAFGSPVVTNATTTLELGGVTDTTLSRSSAGVLAVEGVIVPTVSSVSTLTGKTLTSPKITSGNAPANASSTGVAGQIEWDASFIYICTATNTWKRVGIATW